jgi:heat shock protein HslJ
MSSRFQTAIACSGAAFLIAGCSGTPTASPASPGDGPSLTQSQSTGPSRWELVRWQEAGGALKSIPHGDNGEPIILTFSEGLDAAQGTMSGNAGCNRVRGSYSKISGGIRFGALVSTKMACEPGRMALEHALMKAFSQPLQTVASQPSEAAAAGRQVIWKTADGDLLQFHERESLKDRGQPAAQRQGVEKTVYVDAQRVPCTGVAPMQCLRVRESTDAPWNLWYGGIDGFDFKPGKPYTLRILETKVENPPADASSIRWKLIREEVVDR